MRYHLIQPSKPTSFAILMVAAALTSLMPARWTACGSNLTQPISPLTWAVSSSLHYVRYTSDNFTSSTPTRDEYAKLEEQNQRHELQLHQQAVMLAELEDIIRDLSGVRGQLNDERVRLIIAAVIGGETSPLRETIRISKGARHGVKVGDWVAAGMAREDVPGGVSGRELLMQQWIIGIVSRVYPYVSDVQLTTDPGFRPSNVFWAARPVGENRWEIARRECGIEGIGNQRMRVDRAAQDYLSEGYTIILAPLAYPQPLGLAVGRIIDVKSLDTGLHYRFEVVPWGAARNLSHVYVISTSEP